MVNQKKSAVQSKLCPLMSTRLINEKMVPTLIKCQLADCALFDTENNCCVFMGIKIELIKVGENE